VEHAPVAIFVNRDGSIVLANAACMKLFGASSADDLLGRTPYELFHPDCHEDIRERIRVLQDEARAVPTVEERIVRLDGGEVDVEVTAAPFHDRDADAIHVVLSDITERKRAERALAEINDELEQRVLDRTAQLDTANRELEAFAYSVSHDLRAPLRHLSGFSELLADRAGDALDEKSRHYLDTILRSAREMGVLIDDLLQFSRTGRVEVRLEDVDMEEALGLALETLRHETDARAIEWRIAPLPHVTGDRALLRQVWANLLGNAVKYTRTREPAVIEVGVLDGAAAERPGDVFFVRDNGVGFDMQYAHKLFGVFQRLHSSGEFEGTGIGLANVQRIVTRLGGRVWAEGATGEGATFFFSLPHRKGKQT
jgi:PAS domain S-box-containing protein